MNPIQSSPSYLNAIRSIRAMLDGTLAKTNNLDLGQLSENDSTIQQLFEAYQQGGQGKVWDMMGAIVTADPQLAESVLSELPTLYSEQETDAFRIYTAAEYMQRPPVKYLDADKTIPERGLIMVFGAPGKGKSLWQKHKTANIADQVPILLVLGEGQNGTPDRLRAEQMARGKPLSDQFLIYDRPIDLRDQEAVGLFIVGVKASKVPLKLIILDTLSTCSPGADENSSRDISLILVSCKRICLTLETALMLIHHSTKEGSDYRGHSSLHGNVDMMLVVKQDKEGIVSVSSFKSKDGPPTQTMCYRIQAYVTRKDPDTGEDVTGAALIPLGKAKDKPAPAEITAPKVRITPNQRKILEILATHQQGLKRAELGKESGEAKSSFKSAFDKLVEDGFIVQSEEDRFTLAEAGKASLPPQPTSSPGSKTA